jgi:diguanylate cyclase
MLAGMITMSDINSKRDVLMGIPNRRQLEERIGSLLDEDIPFGLLIADIDFFKSFNDRYGHAVGDEVLAHVANRLKKNLRSTDFIARYGGEEIIILILTQDKEVLVKAAERFRESIEKMESFVSGYENLPGVTISIGAGLFNGGNFKKFFETVDLALYKAKEGGRNRVEVAE